MACADPACPLQEGPQLWETETEIDKLRGEVQFLQHGLQLHKMHGCEECVKAVFVVTSERTGSTSILHMLNQIPGYDIKGGNHGLWKDIYAMNKERLGKWKGYKGSSLYAWHQHSGRNDSELDCSLRLMLLAEINPDPHARVVGFRDSMWSFDENLKDLELLLQVFPCAKVIMSFRKDLEAQLLSQSFALGDYQYFLTQQANEAMRSFAEQHSGRVFSMAMEDLNVTTFNRLLTFLGEERCRSVGVVHDNEGRHFATTSLAWPLTF